MDSWTYIFLTFLVSICLLFVTSQSLITNIQEVVLSSPRDCSGSVIDYDFDDRTPQYNVSLRWNKAHSKNCSEEERGFYCSQTFMQRNNFDNLGTRLCIDLQGVQDDIGQMNQLLVTVYNRDQDLKRVYSITRLSPRDSPYYVCTMPNSNDLSVSISVRDSVKICPEILDFIYNRKIRMGSVRAQPLNQITDVDFVRCHGPSALPERDSNMIKVHTDGMYTYCQMKMDVPQPYSHMRGCIKLVWFGEKFNCDAVATITQGGKQMIEFPVDQSHGRDNQLCENFSGRKGELVLTIKAYDNPYRNCRDNFAIQLDFRQTITPDTGDDASSGKPNLYMAVFISLISICLVCLGLTCLCCIRFRAKRMQRLQQRTNNRQGTVLNQGFRNDNGEPPYDGISWSPGQPAMLFGLPSYEEVVGGSGSGVNPSDDSYKNELPPAYDAVCSADQN